MLPLIVAEQIRQGVSDFLAATFPGTTPGFDGMMARFLAQPENLARGPYVTVGLPFRKHAAGSAPFAWLRDFVPYAHQARAFERLAGAEPRSTLVATGTGSGKTECFLYPLLEHCRQQRQAGRRGIKAILIYPMNALASDQAGRLAREIVTHPQLSGITAGLYVGDEPAEKSTTVRKLEGAEDRYTVITDRERIREAPPDILLTNYKMLDFLLIRARDSELWQHNAPDGLRFLVVDELHSFDGAQGTDLACLIRRLKARLGTPPGGLTCVGTSATLGTQGDERLIEFARDVFGEAFEADAVIQEDRESVAEYLASSTVEYVLMPGPSDMQALSPLGFETGAAYLAAQYALWFDTQVTADEVVQPAFRVGLGEQLKQHVAFQNLLRDLARLGGRAVALKDLVATVRRRLRDADAAPERYPALWLSSLLSLVSHAASGLDHRGERIALLTVRVDLWMRELRRMVASLAPEPALVHSDDLPANEQGLHLAPIHCRDCHAMGWGAVQTRTDDGCLKPDLQSFYAAFFSNDVTSRFVFPVRDQTPENPRKFERKRVCTACGRLNLAANAECTHCGRSELLLVDVAQNLKRLGRNSAALTISHHDCPYCEGDRTLTIVGSQAASLASVSVGQLFGSRYNREALLEADGGDKKLIAFSDSVQDAAHRAGFFEARTWRFNLRPAMAQAIHAAARDGQALTLASLPVAFAAMWQPALGERGYITSFLPPAIAWLRDYDRLREDPAAVPTPYLRELVRRGLSWAMLGEFAQDAHVGRTLPRTQTASVAWNAEDLDAAARSATASLRGQMDALRSVGEADVRNWMVGLLARMMRVGAVWDEGLRAYARHGCNIHVYKHTNAAEYAMLKVPRKPRFLSLIPYEKCDAVVQGDAAFYRDWAFKALPQLNADPLVDDTAIAGLYRVALLALESCRIVEQMAGEKQGSQVWAVSPAACTLMPMAIEWRCGHCHGVAIHDPSVSLEGTPCRQLGCRGHYRRKPEAALDFYRQLYLSADLRRVFAREHTGLLARDAREQLEKDFRDGKVNLLSATPTLEMGIDIGDLSAVLLCSVPPAQANYVQRAGRAGRRTGNALAATLAAGRPHDLYFWADPREMLAGHVDSPGVFLNASAVLERQLTAYTLDCWVKSQRQLAKIPGRLSDVLAAVRNRTQSRFPYPWLSFIAEHRGGLLAGFVGMFTGAGAALTDDSVKFLETFIQGGGHAEGSIAWRILNRLEDVIRDLADLKKRRDRVEAEIARVEAAPVRGETDEEELKELRQEKAALTRLMAGVNERDTLGFLTDQGLLPNYAFPEQGVLLHSVIIRDDRKSQPDEERILTFEYERPGAAAITELAPSNAFYAQGRKVNIEQVDVSRDKPALWRFCRSCSYAADEATSERHDACPRCGDTMWSDAGRLQPMLRLTKVYARSTESASRIGDDADDRERHFYLRQALIDVDPRAVRQAWAVRNEAFPFAFEFIDRVRFREVNFGEQGASGQPIQIAGNDEAKAGFALCPECGTLQRRRRSAEEQWKNHALYCSRRKQPANGDTQAAIFLYREFMSEGIRMYLPEASVGTADDCVQSFVAALQMGLELRFKGSVDHLRVARDVRIAQSDEPPRQYLVIYDSVPGGTGYLKDLMRDERPLFEVFKQSLDKLTGCGCNSDEHKDGCYRCLYGYHNSYGRKQVSRRIAVLLLTDILNQQGHLHATDNISRVAQNALFDSELERRFIEALRRRPPDGSARFEVREEIVRGKPGYFVQAGAASWTLEPQVDLGPEKGVVIACRPDFVLWPESAPDCKPIAVFLDGWKHHRDRIGDDIAKRMAVARSGRFTVWTLTADEVSAYLEPGSARPETPWASALAQGQDQAAPIYGRFGIDELRGFHLLGALEQLRLQLSGADHAPLERLAAVLAIRIGAKPLSAGEFDSLQRSASWENLTALTAFTALDDAELGRCWSAPMGQLQISSRARRAELAGLSARPGERSLQPSVVLRWGENAEIQEQDRRRLWQQFWHACNLLLPMSNTWVVADRNCPMAALEHAPAFAARAALSPEWAQAAILAASEVQALMTELFAAGLPCPVVGFELMDDGGCVVGDAELAWPQQKKAILLPGGDAKPFIDAGWAVRLADDAGTAEDVIAGLR
ncbi:MAG: DEAD/DEAH box helicase [Pseudomonadota bacterium]